MPPPSARIIEGRIGQIRLAAPAKRNDVFLRIGSETIWGPGLDSYHVALLRACHFHGTAVRVGVMEAEHGLNRFRWAVPARGEPIPPDSYREAQRRSGREAAICGAVGLSSLGAAWLFGLDSMLRIYLMVFSLAVALIALTLAGWALWVLWHNYRDRPLILASAALYDPTQRPAAATANPPAPPPRLEPLALRDDGEPPILHVRGHLDGITHESRHVHKGPSYGHYRFSVNGQAYVMTVDESLGSWQPFLAEDDRVEMAVQAGPSQDEHHVVYALRNLEDGRNYMCHLRFRAGPDKDSPIGVGMGQRAPMLKAIGGLMLAAWLFIVGMSYFSGSDASPGELPEMAIFIATLSFVVWLGFALPLLWLDTRWRMGRPTRRQRITERIYALLDLGTPFSPTQRIEEV